MPRHGNTSQVLSEQDSRPQIRVDKTESVLPYTSPMLRSMNSYPVMVNALNIVVSMTTLEVSTPSYPMFRAIT